jgi:Raf kinase inhibitor-like YbhB/YbcL family protein
MSLERPIAPDPYAYLPPRPWFELTSTDLVDGSTIPMAHVHTSAGGQNISPQLAWSGAPSATQGYVVTCFDPDAPTASGFWHWSVLNLPASVTHLDRGAGESDATLPDGAVHALTDFGTAAYGGSAPPQGDHPHRYMFVVHALDVPSLGLDAGSSPVSVGFHLAFHTLARARISVTFAH